MPFKTCPKCSADWSDRDQFLNSVDVFIIGYQADFIVPGNGLLLFNHEKQNCGTTLAVPVLEFDDLYIGIRYAEPLLGKKGCSGYCLRENDLNSCQAKCMYAFVREIIQTIKAIESTRNAGRIIIRQAK